MSNNRSCTPPRRSNDDDSPDLVVPCAAAAAPVSYAAARRVSRRLGLDDESRPSTPTEVHECRRSSGAANCICTEESTPCRPSAEVRSVSMGGVGGGGGGAARPRISFEQLNVDFLNATCQTPDIRSLRNSASCPGAEGRSVMLLYTPQVDPARIAWRASIDSELDDINADHRCAPMPPVTTLVDDRLYLGGFPDEETVPVLREKGIKHIINCCAGDYITSPDVAAEFCVHEIQSFDQQDYLILHHDYDVFLHILKPLFERGEKVFVHCIAGINRSVTLCSAFLIEHLRIDPVQAVRYIREHGRMRILENRGFRNQLVDHHLQLLALQVNDE